MTDVFISIFAFWIAMAIFVFVFDMLPPFAESYVKRHSDEAMQWILEK